jgi:hypothetical protein
MLIETSKEFLWDGIGSSGAECCELRGAGSCLFVGR